MSPSPTNHQQSPSGNSAAKGIRKRRLVIVLLILSVVTAFFIIGLRNEIVVTKHHIAVPGVHAPIRVAVIADSHSNKFADNQQELANILKRENPDLILLAGDIIDDVLPFQQGFDAIRQFPDIAPTFYVTGNHEYWSGQVDQIKKDMEALGIHVLSGDTHIVELAGQQLAIAGLDDPEVGTEELKRQIARIEASSSDIPRILLSHRPERIDMYEKIDADVIVSGHAHGGQWRIPVLLDQGFYGPDQGFFPKIAGGVHELAQGQKLLMSRGLTRDSTRVPRFYNPPEIVIMELEAPS